MTDAARSHAGTVRGRAPITKLTPADFRFVSAWVQGIAVQDAWQRYQAHRGEGDLRRIRTTVRTILDQLAAVAIRHGDPQAAAILRRDPVSIKPSRAATKGEAAAAAMPTLAQFAATLADADFYSERELVELLEERYGKVASLRPDAAARTRSRETPELRAIKRKARLVARQLEALRRLETLAASRPVPADPTAAWLDRSMCQRLQTVGVLTLQEAMFYMRLHGYRWYRAVPGVGEGKARRLIQWLGEHEDTLGGIAPTALAPLSKVADWLKQPPPAIGVVPIERLRVPSSLSGERGSNRAATERCKARARNDYQAVVEWLELRRPSADTGNAHTFRAYRKEAERFLLWAVFERHKALSDLDHVDCIEYRRFLADVGPLWIGEKSVPRWSEHWRPFEGQLGLRSRKAAEAVVTTMCAWLAEVRYLDFNPWRQVPKVNRGAALQELRSLSDKQWKLVDAWLQALPDTPANDRLRMMFALALATGMREAELAGARAGWLRQDTDEEGELAWSLIVLGKGHKEREVPLTAKVTHQLESHLDRKGLGADLSAIAPAVPLLSGLAQVMTPLQPERVYELMKAALAACADTVEDAEPKAAQRIRQASPHWLRHTHGRKFVEAGGDRGVLRQNLGHASDATTAIYDRSGARHRRKEIEKVFG